MLRLGCEMDVTCEAHDLMDTVWLWEICATFGEKFPDGVLCTSHSSMCLSNEPCTYVQGIASRTYMHHPLTEKELLAQREFWKSNMLFFLNVIHLCAFMWILFSKTNNCTTVKIMFCTHNLSYLRYLCQP